MLDNPLIGDVQLSCVDQFPTMCTRISGTNPLSETGMVSGIATGYGHMIIE